MAAPNNPKGGKADKIWREAIHRAVKRVQAGTADKKLEKLADKLIDEALEGNVAALKEIGDRLDGKPAQALEHSGGIEVTKIVREIVRVKD